jgi:hypothetical protein
MAVGRMDKSDLGLGVMQHWETQDPTDEEKREAGVVMAASALRIEKWRHKGEARTRKDLVTVLLLLGIREEVPQWWEERDKLSQRKYDNGKKSQWPRKM